MKLNNDIKAKLMKTFDIKDDDPAFAKIEGSDQLVTLLNSYTGIIGVKGNAEYNRKDNILYIQAPLGSNLASLGHELGHAIYNKHLLDENSQQKKPDAYNTAEEYSKAIRLAEGEAIYYGYTVAKEIGDRYYENVMIWENSKLNTEYKDFSHEIAEIVTKYGSSPSGDMFQELGKINEIMIFSGQLDAEVPATYHEYDVWYYLTTKQGLGDLLADYKEVMGEDLILNSYHAKSLLNGGHKFYGENDNDTIEKINLKTGSPYGDGTPLSIFAEGRADLLYGGKGNDTIYGDEGNDIILGGDDDDHLYGKGGKDTLSGGKGKDTLDGGAGFDKYYADKEDTIEDAAAGKGEVYLDKILLETAYKESEGVYKDEDGNIYKFEDSDLIINGGLRIEKFLPEGKTINDINLQIL